MNEVEKAKKVAELSRKANSAKSELKHARERLESDIRFGRDTTSSSSEVELRSKQYKALEKEMRRPIYK